MEKVAVNSRSYDDYMEEQLEDRSFAYEYLQEAIKEDPGVFLVAVRRIAGAQGISMSDLADATGMSRTSLYRVFHEESNPEFRTMFKICEAIGYPLRLRKARLKGRHPRKNARRRSTS